MRRCGPTIRATSVERLFASHIDMMSFPCVHCIYTIPPWLKFLLRQNVRITLLPTIHLWRNDAARSRDEPGWQAFRSLVERRLGADGLARLFGLDENALVDAMIDVCGGQFRDLPRIMRETLLRASALPALPITLPLVERAISAARGEFLPLSVEDAKWLAEIARIRATALQSNDPATVNRLARFLDNHSVLYFINGNEWYDVHPLIRDEIQDVLAAVKE